MADPRRPVHICTCADCQLTPDVAPAPYHRQINQVLSCLTEPQRRWYVGSLSLDPAGPSDTQLARITGLSLPTIRRGRREACQWRERSLSSSMRRRAVEDVRRDLLRIHGRHVGRSRMRNTTSDGLRHACLGRKPQGLDAA